MSAVDSSGTIAAIIVAPFFPVHLECESHDENLWSDHFFANIGTPASSTFGVTRIVSTCWNSFFKARD